MGITMIKWAIILVGILSLGKAEDDYEDEPIGNILTLRDMSSRSVSSNIIAPKHIYPHQVSMQWYTDGKWRHFCGGSIIGEDKVSTAAHCLEDYNPQRRYRIVAGAHNILMREDTQQFRRFQKIVVHPKYNEKTIDYDFAVIYTRRPWEFGSYVNSIELPSKNYIAEGNCITSGWGITNNGEPADELRHVNLTIVSHDRCRKIFRPFDHFITDRMACAGGEKGKGTCQGDSGGPLVCDNYLVGISSWVFRGCGRAGYPSGFSNVTAAVQWFRSV